MHIKTSSNATRENQVNKMTVHHNSDSAMAGLTAKVLLIMSITYTVYSILFGIHRCRFSAVVTRWTQSM